MPFIGNQPALSYTSFAKQDFTTSATTSYTLSQPVANENEIALFINFVRQEPTTAYTANGTSLTLTSATSASDDMYAIFLGKAVQTVNPPAGSVGTSQLADTSVTSAKISYPLTTFSSTGIDDNATTNAITIESTERVQFTRPRSNTLGDSALEIQPSDTVIGYGFRIDQATNSFIIEKSSPSGSEAERMRIDSSGRILINTTSHIGNSSYLNIANTYTNSGMAIKSNTSAAHHAIEFHNTNNQVGFINTSGTSTVYSTSSDYRLKENVVEMTNATDRLKQLQPKRFNFIADEDTTVDGFLAHEVSNIVPEAISGEKDATKTKEKVVVDSNGNVIAENIEQADWETGKIADEDGNTQYPTDSTWEATKVVPVYQGIDQSKLVPLLVKTIQELEARITALENN